MSSAATIRLPTSNTGRTRSTRRFLRHACVLSVLAFGLHILWESAQCRVFFVHGTYDTTWLAMAMAALGDVGLTWAIYALVAVISRQWRWTAIPWSWKQLGVLLLAGVAIGVAIEIRAIETGRWSYNESMPLLPIVGIGIVPLIQLVLLSPILYALAERLAPSVDKPSLTEVTRRRYDRIAPLYDAFEWLMELRFRSWRKDLWSQVEGETILELGIGTGKNIPFHPVGKCIVGIDLSERMLERALVRSSKLGLNLQLGVADAQSLPFADASFDSVVATFLFCSVPDPVLALREARRVLKPRGRLRLLEHVVSKKRGLRTLMHWLDPIPLRIWGAHIDRDTTSNVGRAGFNVLDTQNKLLDIVKSITAARRQSSSTAHEGDDAQGCNPDV